MLNADSEEFVRWALASDLRDEGLPNELAKQTMREVVACFPGFEAYWSNGIGLHLQNIDAEICTRVQKYFRKRGISILSIHDSFIVPAQHQQLLEEIMELKMR